MVSIKTVARIVPRGIPRSSCALRNTSFQSLASKWLSIFGK